AASAQLHSDYSSQYHPSPLPGGRDCRKILRMRKFIVLAQAETPGAERLAASTGRALLFRLFYQVEIRYRQLLQRQSRTRSWWRCPPRYGTIMAIIRLSVPQSRDSVRSGLPTKGYSGCRI